MMAFSLEGPGLGGVFKMLFSIASVTLPSGSSSLRCMILELDGPLTCIV